jgi:hypothetical protein
MPTLVNIKSVETTTVDTNPRVRMNGNQWEGYVCLPELPTFLNQLEMYGSSDEEEHNNTDKDDDDRKYTGGNMYSDKSEGCYHMEMVDEENVKEMVGKPPPRRSAREKEKKKPNKEKKKPDPLSDWTNITTQHHDIKKGKPGKSSKKKKATSLESTSVMQQTKPTKSKRGDATAYLEKKEETKSFDWR